MTSWVLTIAKDYPNHWDIAKQHMLWDMATSRPITSGDVVYFWISQYGFIGRADVASTATPLTGDEVLPWTDEGEREYVSRFRFARTADLSRNQVTWSEVKANTGFRQSPSWAPHTDESAAEAWLASLFEPFDAVEAAFPDEGAAERAVVDPTLDTRDRAQAQVALRRGQPAFRQALLAAYRWRCAVTGSTTESVLEAAHISPYRGEHTNVTENGLLLRSDVHTLFDAYQLTVVADGTEYVVRVSPDIDEELYRSLDRKSLVAVPTNRNARPGDDVLRQHNDKCPWLDDGGRRPRIDTRYSSDDRR